jgi:hypothetical protein
MFAAQNLVVTIAYIMDDPYMPKGLWKRSIGRIPLGFMVHGTLLKRHVGGTWVYTKHTVGGVTRRSHYLVGETWDTSAARIFQSLIGNGHYGAVLGRRYHQRKAYKVPWPNGNPAAEAARTALAQAVTNWQSILTEEQKIDYNNRATRRGRMYGYNLYISEYIKANT